PPPHALSLHAALPISGRSGDETAQSRFLERFEGRRRTRTERQGTGRTSGQKRAPNCLPHGFQTTGTGPRRPWSSTIAFEDLDRCGGEDAGGDLHGAFVDEQIALVDVVGDAAGGAGAQADEGAGAVGEIPGEG